jgi:hypothetical protein
MAKKIKLDWQKFEIARVTYGALEDGADVRIAGQDCQVGDYLVRTSEGIRVVSSDEVEGIEWLHDSAEGIPDLEID